MAAQIKEWVNTVIESEKETDPRLQGKKRQVSVGIWDSILVNWDMLGDKKEFEPIKVNEFKVHSLRYGRKITPAQKAKEKPPCLYKMPSSLLAQLTE